MPLTQIPTEMFASDMATQVELDAEATLRAAGDVKLTGDVIQAVFASNSANTVLSVAIPADNTIPQNTEGTQILSATITPTSASSILQVDVLVQGSELTNVGDSIIAALFRDSGANAVAAGSTAATTFNMRAGNNSGAMTLNATHQNINLGGMIASTLMVTELKA